MRFTIEREQLLQTLQRVIGVVERRQSMPILANALLKIEQSAHTSPKLTVVATDSEVELSAFTEVAEIQESFSITVPARKLMDITKALPDKSSIEFVLDGSKLSLKAVKSKFTLLTLPAEDFPLMNEGPSAIEFSIPSKDLRYLIDHVYFSMAQQDVRYYLNGMCLEVSPKEIKAITSDGHRLSLSSIASPSELTDMRVIVPRKGIIELLRLLGEEGEVQVQVSPTYIQVQGEKFIFTSKLIDGRYPDYTKVFPKGTTAKIQLDRDEFKQVLTRVAVLSNEKSHGVKMLLRPQVMSIHTNNLEHEQAQDEIAINYEGPELEIGFNVTYFLDALHVLPAGNVDVTFSDNNSSALVEAPAQPGLLYVIMPMRL